METNLTRQQILINRKHLAGLYDQLQYAKYNKRIDDEEGNIGGEYFWHNYLKVIRSDIAKLVVLQKALKDDVMHDVMMDRHIRGMQKDITEWFAG